MMHWKEFTGSYALITGGSSGIGKAFAFHLAGKNIHSVIVSNEKEELENTRTEIMREAPQTIILYRECDLSDTGAVRQLLTDLEGINIRIVVNCAGIGFNDYFIKSTEEQNNELIDVDMKAVVNLTHYFCVRFSSYDFETAIINISSINSEFNTPIPFSAVYSACKVFVKYFTEAIHYELKNTKIKIMNVSCGPTTTNFQKKAKTNYLNFAEDPANVPTITFKYIGKKSSVITNPVSRYYARLVNMLPYPRTRKIAKLADFYSRKLGNVYRKGD